MRQATWSHVFFAAVTLGLYAWNVTRFFWISDDGYICFRFAENLAAGHGLVYNVGERVEGYTQPMWVLLMTIPHWLGAAPEPFAGGIGIAAGLGVLILLVRLSLRVGGNTPWIWVAPLCLVTNRTFCMWSTGGLETQLFVFLLLASTIRFVHERESKAAIPWGSSLLFAVTTFERPEGALYFGIAGLFFAFEVFIEKRRSLRALLWWAVPYAVLMGAHVLWRYGYYGYLLPNTFYAKVSGAWFEQGYSYLTQFARSYHLLYVVPIFALLPFVRPGAIHLMFAVQILALASYVLYVGGDHFEFRFMTPVLPQLYWLAADVLRRLTEEVGWVHVAPTLRRVAGAALALGLVMTSAWTLTHEHEYGFKDQIASWELLSAYSERRVEEGKYLRRLVEKGYLDGDELVAVTGAGALPYHARMPVLDLHGLNDTVIAHTPIEERGRVGHEKTARPEYVQERGVVICDLYNRLVFDHLPEKLCVPHVDREFYSGPVHCVKALDRYLLFGSAQSEADFRRTFAEFEVIQ